MTRVGVTAAIAAAALIGAAPAGAEPLSASETVKCTAQWAADNLTWTPGNPEPGVPEPRAPLPYDCL